MTRMHIGLRAPLLSDIEVRLRLNHSWSPRALMALLRIFYHYPALGATKWSGFLNADAIAHDTYFPHREPYIAGCEPICRTWDEERGFLRLTTVLSILSLITKPTLSLIAIITYSSSATAACQCLCCCCRFRSCSTLSNCASRCLLCLNWCGLSNCRVAFATVTEIVAFNVDNCLSQFFIA